MRLYPEVFFHTPVALSHVSAVLRLAADLVKPGSGRLACDASVAASKQGRFRLRLISTVNTRLWPCSQTPRACVCRQPFRLVERPTCVHVFF